jgi:hypothetical protein
MLKKQKSVNFFNRNFTSPEHKKIKIGSLGSLKLKDKSFMSQLMLTKSCK